MKESLLREKFQNGELSFEEIFCDNLLNKDFIRQLVSTISKKDRDDFETNLLDFREDPSVLNKTQCQNFVTYIEDNLIDSSFLKDCFFCDDYYNKDKILQMLKGKAFLCGVKKYKKDLMKKE